MTLENAFAVLVARVAEPDLIALTDAEVSARLNAPDASLPKTSAEVSVHDARQVLMTTLTPDQSTTSWIAILETAVDAGSPLRKQAMAAREFIDRSHVIDLTDPTTEALVHVTLGSLVAGGIITENARQKLLALAERPQSWAHYHGITVTSETVFEARGRAKIVQEGK